MSKGYIRLHRQLKDCWLWKDKEPFDRRSAWLDLLLSANHCDKKILFEGKVIVIRKGQFHTSILQLSERWKWNRKKTANFLKILENDEMVTTKSTTHGTTITIVNWDKYQYCGTTEDTTDGTNEGQPCPTNNNDNNDNNVIKRKEVSLDTSKRKNFIPPTVDEVAAYCRERENYIDPEKFVDYYTSKGWLVGSSKMKDWKAAVRNWERRSKESGYVSQKNKPKDTKLMEYGRKIYEGDEQRNAPYFGFPPEWFDGEQLVEERIVPLVCDKAYVQGGREDYEFTVEELKGLYESRKRGKQYEQCFDDIFDS
jgi:hypothetical protein